MRPAGLGARGPGLLEVLLLQSLQLGGRELERWGGLCAVRPGPASGTIPAPVTSFARKPAGTAGRSRPTVILNSCSFLDGAARSQRLGFAEYAATALCTATGSHPCWHRPLVQTPQPMYLVVIAWLYVALMMAVAEATNPPAPCWARSSPSCCTGRCRWGFLCTSWARRRASGRSRSAKWLSKRPTTRSSTRRRRGQRQMKAPRATLQTLTKRPLQSRQMQAAKRPLPRAHRCRAGAKKSVTRWTRCTRAAVLSLP